MGRHVDERRTTFRDEGGRKFAPGALHHVKRAALRIEDSRGAFHDQPMQISGADGFGKRLTETVEKIEDERLLDLDFLLGAFELADANRAGATR